jgi:hypothetical protein
MLPTVVIAGAPKCGTSSLFRWFADHPDVLGSNVKETCYFVDVGTHVFNVKRHFLSGGIEGYERFFVPNGRVPRLIIEATPTYIYSDCALRSLTQITSKPHFIFLLREPVSQIRSIFQYFQTNWNWIPSDMTFSEFISASQLRVDNFGGNELAQNVMRNAAYVDFLVKWREACGAERIHVFLFEEAFSDARRFMHDLAEQFGINSQFYDTYKFPRENQTYLVRSKALQKVNVSVRSLFPQGAMYRAVRSLYRSLNTRRVVAGQMLDHELEATLAEKYRLPNERLAEEFNLNLAAWTTAQELQRMA